MSDSIKSKIRSIPHWPVETVTFRDITTLMQDSDGLREACDILYERYKNAGVDKVAGIEARGFIFGSVLAYKLGVGFIPVRKKGKLPYKTVSQQYFLEYGSAEIEIHTDSVKPGEKVIIVDDLIATGGTAAASALLIEKLGGVVYECAFVVELSGLGGRKALENYKVFSVCEFEGE